MRRKKPTAWDEVEVVIRFFAWIIVAILCQAILEALLGSQASWGIMAVIFVGLLIGSFIAEWWEDRKAKKAAAEDDDDVHP